MGDLLVLTPDDNNTPGNRQTTIRITAKKEYKDDEETQTVEKNEDLVISQLHDYPTIDPDPQKNPDKAVFGTAGGKKEFQITYPDAQTTFTISPTNHPDWCTVAIKKNAPRTLVVNCKANKDKSERGDTISITTTGREQVITFSIVQRGAEESLLKSAGKWLIGD